MQEIPNKEEIINILTVKQPCYSGKDSTPKNQSHISIISKTLCSCAKTKMEQFVKDFQTWFSPWYLLDWISAIFAFGIGEIMFSNGLGLAPTFHRAWKGGQLSHSFPLSKDLFPGFYLFILVCPCVLMLILLHDILLGSIRSRSKKTSKIKFSPIHDFHHACLGFTEATALNLYFTRFFNLLAGRERPDFMERLEKTNYNDSSFLVRQGRRSFPSGHAAWAFLGMTYLSLYFCGKFKLFSVSGHAASFPALVLITLPLFGAFCIAVSRTMDYHHFFSDIDAGAVIGMLEAFVTYNLNFNSLTSRNCQSPRTRKTKMFMCWCIKQKRAKRSKEEDDDDAETEEAKIGIPQKINEGISCKKQKNVSVVLVHSTFTENENDNELCIRVTESSQKK